MILQIHTDGACSGNQEKTNTGGWGAILQYGNHEKELFRDEENTTLQTVAVNRQRLSAERLLDKIRNDAPVVQPHPRPIRIKNTDDPRI